MACVVFIVGALTMGLARSYAALVAGRVITGLGVGCGIIIAPLYTSELAPAAIRGRLVAFSEVTLNFGILLGYVGAYVWDEYPLATGWRYMLGFGAVLNSLLSSLYL